MSKVRVRFAPSPTGPLHLGGVRTALYDYLFAKNQGGDFVLRIEDTDTARYVEGAEEYIMKALEWCGIIPDESPIHGGNYGPYRQSERRDIYDKYTAEILKTDYAYIAFDTPEELEKVRAEYEAKGEVFSYNNFTRNSMRNSLTLSEQETQELINQNVPYVVRFKMPIDRIVNLEDIIRGKSSVNTNTLDDKVLVKNDGMPTYHFANIIDDHEMEITHVIRGEEWLPSMPLHVLLYEAMGWTGQISRRTYAGHRSDLRGARRALSSTDRRSQAHRSHLVCLYDVPRRAQQHLPPGSRGVPPSPAPDFGTARLGGAYSHRGLCHGIVILWFQPQPCLRHRARVQRARGGHCLYVD